MKMPSGMTKTLSACLFFLTLIAAPFAWAAQYSVTVNATVNNDQGYPTVFGSTTAIPVVLTFTVDTALSPVKTIPANTVISTFGGSFATDIQLIQKASITNFNLVIGTSTFSAADLQPGAFDPDQTYDIALLAPLTTGTATGILLDLHNPSLTGGDFGLGGLNCNGSACSEVNNGFAVSGSDGGQGTVSNITTTVVAVVPTAQAQIQNLASVVSAASNLKSTWKNDFVAALNQASKALAKGQKALARLYIVAFAAEVELAKLPASKSGLTPSQATQFLTASKAIYVAIGN